MRDSHLTSSFIFMTAFPLGKVAGEAALVGMDTPHGFQQPLIDPLAPHQDGTK